MSVSGLNLFLGERAVNAAQALQNAQSGLSDFLKGIFKQMRSADVQPEKKPVFSYTSKGVQDLAADESMLLRDIATAILPDSPAFHLAGITTALNAFMGADAAVSAQAYFKAAKELRDQWGMTDAMIDTFRGVFQSVAGGSFGVYRVSTILADLKNLNTGASAPTRLGQLSYVSGSIGNALFGIFYGILGANGLYNVVKLNRFDEKLKKPEWLNYLREDAEAYVNKRGGWKAVRKELQSIVTKAILTIAPGSEEAIEREFAGANCAGLVALGLAMALDRQKKRRLAKFERAYGAETAEKLDKMARSRFFEIQLKSSDVATKKSAEAELDTLQKEGQKKLAENKWKQWLFFAVGLIGVIGTVISFVFPPVGIALWIGTALFVLSALLFIYIDGKEWLSSWKGEPGKKDYAFTLVSMALAVGSFVAACFLSGGIPLIIAGVVCAIWVGLGVVSLVKTYLKRQHYAGEHPSLKQFVKRVKEKGSIDEELSGLFRKLPKATRRQVKAQLWGGDYQNAKFSGRKYVHFGDRDSPEFGRDFFMANPLHADVLRAFERCVEIESIDTAKYQKLFDLMQANDVDAIRKLVQNDPAFHPLFRAIWLARTSNPTRFSEMIKTCSFNKSLLN